MKDNSYAILAFIVAAILPIFFVFYEIHFGIYFIILILFFLLPLLQEKIKNSFRKRKERKELALRKEKYKKEQEIFILRRKENEEKERIRKQEWPAKMAEAKRLKKIQRMQPGGISGITDEEYSEMYQKVYEEKLRKQKVNNEWQKQQRIEKKLKEAKAYERWREHIRNWEVLEAEKLAKEKEELAKEREKVEQIEKEELERKIEKENRIKENIKRQILEKEKRKQLESEAIQELLDAGLIDNNFYSGINIREAIPTEVKISVWKRDKECCVTCGSRNNLEFDHIIPVSKGGSNTIRNIQILCRECNRRKSSKIM